MQLSAQQVTVMLPVRDLARARDFYERALALPSGEEKPDGKVVYHCGGTEIALFPKPDGTKAEHTALSFRVDLRGLRPAGVQDGGACLRAGVREGGLVQ